MCRVLIQRGVSYVCRPGTKRSHPMIAYRRIVGTSFCSKYRSTVPPTAATACVAPLRFFFFAGACSQSPPYACFFTTLLRLFFFCQGQVKKKKRKKHDVWIFSRRRVFFQNCLCSFYFVLFFARVKLNTHTHTADLPRSPEQPFVRFCSLSGRRRVRYFLDDR